MRDLSNEKKSTALPLVMAAAGHIIWGFSFLFSKVAQQTATAQVFLSMRFILAFLMLSVIGVVKKEKLQLLLLLLLLKDLNSLDGINHLTMYLVI